MKNFNLSTILMLVASSLIFFFIGRYSVASSSTDYVASTTEKDITTPKGLAPKGKAIEIDEPIVDPVAETDEADKIAEEEAKLLAEKEEADKKAAEEAAAKNRRVENASTIDAPSNLVTSNSLARVKMGISDKKISEVLSSISQRMEDQKLAYVSSMMQDCSGIFHQLKDSLQVRLPSLAAGSQYQYPTPQVARSSRQIADWYHKNNNLLIVQDPLQCVNSIRPGSVMFYGKSNRTFKNIDIDMLTDRDNNYTSNGAIQHIAVVTAVSLDEDGNVVDYTIMHGRRPGKTAHRSGSKKVQSRNKTLPAFGHWSQQWVGIANMATPK